MKQLAQLAEPLGQELFVKEKTDLTSKEKSIYNSRLYMQLEHRGEIYYYDLLSQISINVVSSVETSLRVQFQLSHVEISECSPTKSLFFQKRLDEIKQVENFAIICDINAKGDILEILNLDEIKNLFDNRISKEQFINLLNSNPFFVSAISTLLKPSKKRNMNSFLYPNMPILVEQDVAFTPSLINTNSNFFRVDHNVLNKELEFSNITVGSTYSFSNSVAINKSKKDSSVSFANYVCQENIADDFNVFVSVGLVQPKKKKGLKIFSMFHSLWRAAISACW